MAGLVLLGGVDLDKFILCRLPVTLLLSPERLLHRFPGDHPNQAGVFFKRTDQVALYRMKDYVLTPPFLLQLFYLMNVKLKNTDPENHIIWLRGIPASDLLDRLRGYVQQARLNNKVYGICKPLYLFLSK